MWEKCLESETGVSQESAWAAAQAVLCLCPLAAGKKGSRYRGGRGWCWEGRAGNVGGERKTCV